MALARKTIPKDPEDVVIARQIPFGIDGMVIMALNSKGCVMVQNHRPGDWKGFKGEPAVANMCKKLDKGGSDECAYYWESTHRIAQVGALARGWRPALKSTNKCCAPFAQGNETDDNFCHADVIMMFKPLEAVKVDQRRRDAYQAQLNGQRLPELENTAAPGKASVLPSTVEDGEESLVIAGS
jgi:hypothetical protein